MERCATCGEGRFHWVHLRYLRTFGRLGGAITRDGVATKMYHGHRFEKTDGD